MPTLNEIFPSSLGPVQHIYIFDPANPSNFFQTNLNPTVLKRKPATLRKYVATTNSTAILTGAFEAPPTELSISWNQIDYTQVQGIAPFTQISPVVIVLNDDSAYYGVLCIDNAEQLNNFTRNVWALEASFLTLSPYNGLHTTLNTLVAPTITATLSGSAGYIPNPATIYLWSSVFTSRSADSESVVGPMTTISNTTANAAYALTWTPPSSIYFSKLRLYWNSTNDPTTSSCLTEVYSGFPQDVPNSFTLYNNVVQYNAESPRSFGLAFSGYWASGIWIPV